MWLQIPRLRYQRAAETALGIGAALSDGKLSREWFDGIALHEEQAAALDRRINAERADARALRREGMTSGL